MNDNRRQLPRWSIKRQARFSLDGAAGFEECYIEDMNLKGMRLSCAGQLPQDCTVRMSLSFPDHLDFEVEVEIPWISGEYGRYVYGLSFKRIKDVDKDKIYQYVYGNHFQQIKEQWWQ